MKTYKALIALSDRRKYLSFKAESLTQAKAKAGEYVKQTYGHMASLISVFEDLATKKPEGLADELVLKSILSGGQGVDHRTASADDAIKLKNEAMDRLRFYGLYDDYLVIHGMCNPCISICAIRPKKRTQTNPKEESWQ